MKIHTVDRAVRSRWPQWAPSMLLAVSALNPLHVPGAHAGPGNVPDAVIVVDSMPALQAALTEENAGRVIHLLRGSYEADVPLVIPDHVALRGEGEMLDGRYPSGFDPASTTRIFAAPGFSGDLLTLGDGAGILGLQLEQAAGSLGSVVVVGSRMSGDSIAASIENCEIITPNSSGVGPLGPTGEGLLLTTRNANASAPPAPHTDARISLRMHRSIVRSSASGTGIFAINFGTGGMISAQLSQNTIEGALRVVGGASRGDGVFGATVQIQSEHNVFTAPDVSLPGVGWQIYGGGSTPIPIPTAPTLSNAVYLSSTSDVIEGFETSILAEGAHKFFGLPQQPVSHNLVDLRLRGLSLRTASFPGTADLSLHGARSDGEFTPGDGNVLRVVARNVTGSGYRDNIYADVSGPTLDEDLGQGNRLEFVGASQSFHNANSDIEPAPGDEFFSTGN